MILSYRRGSEEERDFWHRTIERQEQQDGDLETAMEYMKRHRALDDTVDRARHYCSVARDALGLFQEGEVRTALSDVVDFVIDRAY